MSNTTNATGEQRLKEALLKMDMPTKLATLKGLHLRHGIPSWKPRQMKFGSSINQENGLMAKNESAVKLSGEERDRRIRSATLELSVFGITETDVRAPIDQHFRVRIDHSKQMT